MRPELVMTAYASSPTADHILDAADRLLGRYGYRKMTVEDLAREAGIGKGTVYLSFESKQSIALACIDRMVDRLLERLRAIAASAERAPQRLRTMLIERVMHRFDYARQHSSSIDELLANLRPFLLERRASYFNAEAEVLASVLRQGCRDGTLDVDDPLEVAHAMIGATNALLPYSLSVHELGRRSEIERRAGRIADVLLSGVEARPSGVARPSTTRSR